MKESIENAKNKQKPIAKTAQRPEKSQSANVSKSSHPQKPAELHALSNVQEGSLNGMMGHLFRGDAGA